MGQLTAILFGALFTGIVCVALGKLLLRGAGPKLHRQEEDVLSFVCGAACLSLLVFLLGALRLAGPGAFLLLGGAVLALAAARGLHRPPVEVLPPLPLGWKLLLSAVFAVFLFAYLPNALAPEVSPDGSTYHLGLVSRYLREGGIVPVRDNMYAQLSQGIEMLFLFAFAFGRHPAAASVHLLFLMALPLLILAYARRFGFPAAGVCAAIFVFTSPVVGTDGVSAYIDVALACVAFSVFYLVQVWRQAGRPDAWRWCAAIGIAAGFCYATKYTAFVALPYALAMLLWPRRHRPWKGAAVAAIFAALIAAPWIVKNCLFVGNPFAPLLNQVFHNPYLHAGFDAEYARYLRLYDLDGYGDLPKAVTMSGAGGVAGVTGPLFLLAPLGLGALLWPAGRQILLAAVVFGSAYPMNIGTRFLIPAMPFVALAMALVFTRVRFLAPAVAVTHAVFSFPPLVTTYAHPNAWRIQEIPWRAALRAEPEEEFLNRRLRLYGAARMIDRHVPPGERVFAFDGVAEAYTSPEIVTRYQSAFGTLIGSILWTPVLTDTQPTWHVWFRWEERPLRRIRIFQTASHTTDFWSIGEFRVFRGARELPRRPEWRIRAWPNPWEAQLAFDNSPVTRWNTQQPLFPGMFMEVDFGRDEIVSAVRLDCSHDQYGVRLRLDGRYPNGHWQALSNRDSDENGPPIPNLRREATREAKRRGIRYLLIGDNDHEAGDYRDLPDQWGMTQLDEHSGYRLYRIE
jgi:hypothetical protein